MEQQSYLYQAVECEFHDVGLYNHHEQTPPHQTGFEFEVDFVQAAAVSTEDTQHEEQNPQKHE